MGAAAQAGWRPWSSAVGSYKAKPDNISIGTIAQKSRGGTDNRVNHGTRRTRSTPSARSAGRAPAKRPGPKARAAHKSEADRAAKNNTKTRTKVKNALDSETGVLARVNAAWGAGGKIVVGVNPPGTFSPPSPTDMLTVRRGRRCPPPPTASRAPPLLRLSASRTEPTRFRSAAAAATPRGGGGAHKLPPPPPALPRRSPQRHERRGRACSVAVDVGVQSVPSQRGRRSHRDARRHPTADGAISHAVRGKPQSAAHRGKNGWHWQHVWLPTTANL